MGVDLSVFGRQKSVLDYQQLQQAFEQKKAFQLAAIEGNMQTKELAAQNTAAMLQQRINPPLTQKDMMNFEIQQERNAQNAELRKMQIESANSYRDEILGSKQEAIQTKRDQKQTLDQNLLGNALSASQKQIDKIDALFDGEGNLKQDVANNYGTVMGMQTPVFYQDTADARANLNNVNDSGFMTALGDMKSQSATGASGMGSLTEREGDKIQSAASAASDTKQSPESAKTNFLIYKKELQSTQMRLKDNFNNVYGVRDVAPASDDAAERAAFEAERARRGL